jgi:signal transduction histidine kinase
MNPKDHLILYVDDERPNRIVFEQSMAARYRVKTVASAADALELLKSETVAVLITDQRMPEMSGHELLIRIKALYPETIRIVITAYSDIDPILSAVNEGLVARYLIKPWDRAELDDLLSWALQAYELGRQSSALQLRLMQTERLVTLGSIAAAVLHDFNKPLGNIEGNLERMAPLAAMLSRAAIKGAPDAGLTPADVRAVLALAEDLPDVLRDMETSVALIKGLTSSIHQLTRTDREPAPSEVDPLPVIRYAMSVCADIAVRAMGKILYEGPAELPKVRVGSTELTQILINLIANGAQAILARQARGGRVVVRAVDQGHMLRFVISDDGVGMNATILAKAGTPFFSTRAEGTGLGVAQCKRLIGRYKEELQIESSEGRGTTVQFSLPKS